MKAFLIVCACVCVFLRLSVCLPVCVFLRVCLLVSFNLCLSSPLLSSFHFSIPLLPLPFLSEDQKEAFIGFQENDYNEGLLELHEKELDFLKIYYEDHQKLFQVRWLIVASSKCSTRARELLSLQFLSL